MAEFVVFWVMAPIALGAAIAMVLMRSAVHAALLLVVNFFAIAVLYAVLEAQFLATIQIIVYAGAIMVLFLFVLMLLGVNREDVGEGQLRRMAPFAVVLGVALFAVLAVTVADPFMSAEDACPTNVEEAFAEGEEGACEGLAEANEAGNVRGVGLLIFTEYVWPFEVTSVLLVIAALGAMVIGRKTEAAEDLVDRLPDDPHDNVLDPERITST
jgi:NADH-quinone oxidoreductase subunit J